MQSDNAQKKPDTPPPNKPSTPVKPDKNPDPPLQNLVAMNLKKMIQHELKSRKLTQHALMSPSPLSPDHYL